MFSDVSDSVTDSEPEICAEADEPTIGYKVIAMNSLSAVFDMLTSTCCKAKLLLGESTIQRWGMRAWLYVECSVCKIKTFFPISNVEGERLKNIMRKGQTRPQDYFDLKRCVIIAGQRTVKRNQGQGNEG